MVLKDIEKTLLGGAELDDVLEAQITSLPADQFLTFFGIGTPIGKYFTKSSIEKLIKFTN